MGFENRGLQWEGVKLEQVTIHEDGATSFRPELVAVIDIGSPKAGKLGWYVSPAEIRGHDLDALADLIAQGLAKGPCALGFEAPMYVPFRNVALSLTMARPGEGNRAWCAGAGAGALATALAVIPYFLGLLRARAPAATATLNWTLPPKGSGELLVFEAFVSGPGKGVDHSDDARRAVDWLVKALPSLSIGSCLGEEPCFSMLGAALLRTGWSTDLSLLSAPCLVGPGH